MIVSDEAKFFSTGAMLGGFFSSLFCFFFPSLTLIIMFFYGVLAATSLYKLKDELKNLI